VEIDISIVINNTVIVASSIDTVGIIQGDTGAQEHTGERVPAVFGCLPTMAESVGGVPKKTRSCECTGHSVDCALPTQCEFKNCTLPVIPTTIARSLLLKGLKN